jgi:hypothetical protein
MMPRRTMATKAPMPVYCNVVDIASAITRAGAGSEFPKKLEE